MAVTQRELAFLRGRLACGGRGPCNTRIQYDAEGNLIEDDANEYEWDARGQLSAIEGAAKASFAYDPFGRRTSKTLGETMTEMLHDGANVVQEYSEEELVATVLTGLLPDQAFARTTEEGPESFLTDRLGSVIALADAEGEIDTTYSYEPFGAPSTTGEPSDNPFQFTGRENDGTGLQYNRARYYSPSAARFISQDPAGFAGSGTNLYWYANGNPLDFVDPTGEVGVFPVSFPSPSNLVEDTLNKVGGWVSNAPGVLSKADDYLVSCVSNGVWGAAFGAAIGAGAVGAGAGPGALLGGGSGCAQGIAQQGLDDLGQNELSDAVEYGSGARDIGRAFQDVGKEAPELGGRLKDLLEALF